MFTAFVGYQMMVVQWYAVMLAKNGSIRVVSPTKLLERKSASALLSHCNYLLAIAILLS